MIKLNDFTYGIRKGLPIGLGYLFVSFSFGVMVVNKGVAPITGIIMSLTNITSAGQYAGLEMIATRASILEILLTTILINLRYSLMSISLSQKLDDSIPTWQRLIFGFGITDEIFAMSALETRKITFKYMLGLISLPILCWVLGTALGAYSANIMPDKLLNAMNIALYAMFIAIIFPNARKSYKISLVILVAISISVLFYYTPVIKRIGLGFKVIIATVVAAIFGAILFPVEEGEKE